MTDSSKITGLSITSLILGSGLIVFGANSLYSDYVKQPHIDIGIKSGISTAVTNFTNTGIVTAHNVRITFNSSSDISNYRFTDIPDEQVNFTKVYKPGRLVASFPRLTPGNLLSIEVMLNAKNSNNTVPFFVDVTYDEGSTYGQADVGKESKDYKTPLMYPGTFGRLTWFVNTIMVLAGLAFVSPLIIYKIRKLISAVVEGSFVSDIKNEITRIRNELHNNTQLSDIIPTKWDKYDMEHKHQIISNYQDYNKINEFYMHLQERDFYSKNNQVFTDGVRIINEECIYIAEDVLQKVNWQRYISKYKKAWVWYIIFGVIAITAVSLSYVFLRTYLTGTPLKWP